MSKKKQLHISLKNSEKKGKLKKMRAKKLEFSKRVKLEMIESDLEEETILNWNLKVKFTEIAKSKQEELEHIGLWIQTLLNTIYFIKTNWEEVQNYKKEHV